ncbi:hypothetical protein WICPIJ_002845 [Wickerhamomyces pijperi]|uniref:Uncharacterized protein n=1 Tax=Wickerhamomyces pijperi TaxID=599730 RepID=A0A9P8Q880_WICPI|nr:hypothetical protein WICPIJ_002845 [Wickerhamomyces pijperi]
MVPYLFPKSLVLPICPQQTGVKDKMEQEKNPYSAANAYITPREAPNGNHRTKIKTVQMATVTHRTLKLPMKSAAMFGMYLPRMPHALYVMITRKASDSENPLYTT